MGKRRQFVMFKTFRTAELLLATDAHVSSHGSWLLLYGVIQG